MKAPTVNRKNNSLNFLAADPIAALSQLIALTKSLVDFAEQETGALVRGDSIRLVGIQHDKEKMAMKYARCSNEFRERIEEFRGIERNLLDELETAQNSLSLKTAENNILISHLQRRNARANGAQMTLLAAQELGQSNKFLNGNAA